MLIGQTLHLSFAGYLADAALPVALGLSATWALIAWQTRGRWKGESASVSAPTSEDTEAPFDGWQTAKGLLIAFALMAAFLFTSWPREHLAFVAAGLLLMSRKLHSHRMLGLVDWELLVLFMGLFVVNEALQRTGLVDQTLARLAASGVDLQHIGPLSVAAFALSNIVSNVPAVMLLLPATTHALAGTTLALVSTLAGNLLIVGSIANIIVVDAAARRGIRIDWRRHARVGVPVTVITLLLLAAYLYWRMG
jgi:Na+/H+ antiporter NhaD/arsenite permease-like protein